MLAKLVLRPLVLLVSQIPKVSCDLGHVAQQLVEGGVDRICYPHSLEDLILVVHRAVGGLCRPKLRILPANNIRLHVNGHTHGRILYCTHAPIGSGVCADA